jgi:hypothetical protein
VLDNIQAPGFFWVLFVSLLSATTYRVQYGEVIFYTMLILFAAIKAYQVLRENREARRAWSFKEDGGANRSKERSRGTVQRFLMG